MKFEEYQKPDLEELELILEGSFQDDDSKKEGVDKDPNESDGPFED